jgi:phosphoglycerol transferase MdoB-like AlkP superfamily enzyme
MGDVFLNRWKKVLFWLLYLALCYQVSRGLFYWNYHSYFKDLYAYSLLKIFIGGCRFDWVSIVLSNILIIAYFLFPISLSKYQSLSKSILVINFIVSQLFLMFNFIDIPYFEFIHKRSTADIFFQLGGQTEVIKQIPAYLRDYWYWFVIYFVFVYLNFLVMRKIFFTKEEELSIKKVNWLYYSINVIVVVTSSIISIRGGLQRIPLDIVDAGFYAEPSHTVLVLNSPFSIIKSFEQKKLPSLSFFDDKENDRSLKLIKQYPFEKMNKKNIVVIILESFSKEYTGLYKKPSFTPFLDSLMQHSIVFENAWSNGTKSIEGIPAILSSMPSWMDNPFINSLYCNNNTQSFPMLLKKEGYFSAFFHGGINGTMNFDAYSRNARFDKYYGKQEYNNAADFDGYWGIWDEPFLQFVAKEIGTFKEPFFASIFTLSSHHPFNVPDKYKDLLPKGTLPIHQSVAYADLSLKKFFQTIQTQTWYKNTLFVITADHTGMSEDAYYSSIAGRYQIPLIIFDPSHPEFNLQPKIIQQIDVLPTVLYFLQYPHPFFSFGNNYFDTTIQHTAVYYENAYYYLANDSVLVSFNNFKTEKVYQYKNNELKETTVPDSSKNSYELQLKRIIQAYNNHLLKNDIP